jgi:hypothetical protein
VRCGLLAREDVVTVSDRLRRSAAVMLRRWASALDIFDVSDAPGAFWCDGCASYVPFAIAELDRTWHHITRSGAKCGPARKVK